MAAPVSPATPGTSRVVVTNPAFPETLALLEAEGCDLVVNQDAGHVWGPLDLASHAADADAILAFMTDTVDAALLDACPRLRIVACALKGYDNFDVSACTERGVWVTIVEDLLTVPTAELAVGLLIGVGRDMRRADRLVRAGRFAGWRPDFYGRGLAGSTVGIVGFGAVGRAIAQRLRGFGARILCFDRQPVSSATLGELGAALVGFEMLLAESDFVVLALPLTHGTTGLFGPETLGRMKRGAYLVNPARGSLVDEAAVAAALEEGWLAGYAADVFEMEDWARAGRAQAIPAALLDADAPTLLTPHIGSAVTEVRKAIEREAAENILDCLAGRRPRGAINEPALPPTAGADAAPGPGAGSGPGGAA